MSTIHACWLKDKRLDKPNTNNKLTNMLKASEYWQPDAEHLWFSKCALLGIAKAQLFNTNNSEVDTIHHEFSLGLTITANARLDNRPQLLEKLAILENEPYIATDGQLILQCYVKWGRDCVNYLRGDFVFIIWDEPNNKMFSARDQMGVKVLFYSKTSQGVMITNEHNAFFTSNWCDKKIVDEEWLVNNIWGIWSTPFDSPCPDINVLPSGHTLEIDEHGVKITPYWDLKRSSEWAGFNDEQNITELTKRFQNAVETRLDSRYPLGTELSEGLDSNGIAGFAAQYLKTQKLYTFSYQCEALTEKNKAVWYSTYQDIYAMLAMHENLRPVWQSKPVEQVERKKTIDKKRFFTCFGAVIPQNNFHFLRSELAHSKDIRVMLSGWGGDHCVTSFGDEYADELFQKRHFVRLYKLHKAKMLRGRGAKPIIAMARSAFKNLLPHIFMFYIIRRKNVMSHCKRRMEKHFLNKYWRKKFKLEEKVKKKSRNYQRYSIPQKEQLELFELGLENRLIESELIGRMYRLEYRYPMLDIDLLEFAHSLPSHLKIHQGIERYAFRRVLEGVTTTRIQWRLKSDVNHPMLNRAGRLNMRVIALRESLENNKLLNRYSSKTAFEKSLQSKDINIINCCELLADLDNAQIRVFQSTDFSS